MAWGVDQIKLVALVFHLHWGQFNRDTFFTLKFHGVKQLRFHLALFDGASNLHHAVSQGGLTMIDVSNNTKISNIRGIHVYIITEMR